MPTPTLRSGRIALRPLADGDVDPLLAILAQPGVREWWGSLEDVEHTIEGLRNDGGGGGGAGGCGGGSADGGGGGSADGGGGGAAHGGAFAIEVDGALAGWLGYNEESEPDYRHASLDVFLAPEHHGRGLGRNALRLVARWLFEQRGHHRITIDPACSNERAIRAYIAVGFRPVGTMRRYERGPDGSWHDNLLMDLMRDELLDDQP